MCVYAICLCVCVCLSETIHTRHEIFVKPKRKTIRSFINCSNEWMKWNERREEEEEWKMRSTYRWTYRLVIRLSIKKNIYNNNKNGSEENATRSRLSPSLTRTHNMLCYMLHLICHVHRAHIVIMINGQVIRSFRPFVHRTNCVCSLGRNDCAMAKLRQSPSHHRNTKKNNDSGVCVCSCTQLRNPVCGQVCVLNRVDDNTFKS